MALDTGPTGRFGTFEKEAEARRLGRKRTLEIRGVEDPTEFKAPEVDLPRIKELTQDILAPTVSKIRRSVQKVQAGRAPTPTARGVQLREVIRGGGEAIGTAQAGATKAAFSIYSPEYRAKLQEAITRFETTQTEKAREKEREVRRGRIDPSSETFREAAAGLEAFDPFGPTRGVATRTTVPAAIDYTADLLR